MSQGREEAPKAPRAPGAGAPPAAAQAPRSAAPAAPPEPPPPPAPPPPPPTPVELMIATLQHSRDDGSAAIQHILSRLPQVFNVSRAYIMRVSDDGGRLTVTQASGGIAADMLGYTQSLGRVPVFVRGLLQDGVQGHIDDVGNLPLTAQQRKMLWYDGVGATLITPLWVDGGTIGGLVVDTIGRSRHWKEDEIEQLRLLADAIALRLGRAMVGDHLSPAPQSAESPRLNLLANVARVLAASSDPHHSSEKIAEIIADLPFVASAKHVTLADARSGISAEALAAESMVVRAFPNELHLAVPLLLDGERFGSFELVVQQHALSTADEQLLRTLGIYASGAYANALRRKRPRNEALGDWLTGCLSFRSIHEYLDEGLRQARTTKQNLALWLVDVAGLGALNRSQGYAVGDDCISYVGHTLTNATAGRGSVGRLGGGEFLCVLPKTTEAEAMNAAETLIERIEKNGPAHLPRIQLRVGITTSLGYNGGPEGIIHLAQLALSNTHGRGVKPVAAAKPNDSNWMREARANYVQRTMRVVDGPRR